MKQFIKLFDDTCADIKYFFEYHQNGIDIHSQYEEVFRSSCHTGRLDIVQWLWTLVQSEGRSPINIHACDEEAFRAICKEGRLDIAQWLWTLGQSEGQTLIDIHANSAYITSEELGEGIFTWSWLKGSLDILRMTMRFGKVIF